MNSEVMGRNIKRLRKERDMIQSALAKELGLSTVFVSQIENGVRNPGLETLIKIANIFDVTVDFLLTDTINEEKQSKIKEIISMIRNRDIQEIEYVLEVAKSTEKYLNNREEK